MNMFSTIKDKFTGNASSSEVRNDNPNFITQPSRVTHALKLLMDSHVQISVAFEDNTEYLSKILSVTKESLLIDQFSSRTAHRKIQLNSKIKIKAKHHAVPFDFNAVVVDVSLSNNRGYLISTPEKVYHPQKRDFFRLSLGHKEKLRFIGSMSDTNNTVTGYIGDISFGGLSLTTDSATYIKKNSIISNVIINLDYPHEITCDLSVRFIKKKPNEQTTLVGCEILNIKAPSKRSLHQFITETQRKRVKSELDDE